MLAEIKKKRYSVVGDNNQGAKVQDNPAFIRLEGKVDSLICEVRDYKLVSDKNYVCRTEFEVFKATMSPTNKLVSDVIKYIILAIVAAGLMLIIAK